MTIDKTLDTETLLHEICAQLKDCIRGKDPKKLRFIGIHTGGVWIAKRIVKELGLETSIGEINIAFYRDDFSKIGVHPSVQPSQLPFEVNDCHLILVDDILHTGRTVRAAMNEIFDYGRPLSISLVVLVSRSGKELPIHPDVCGANIELSKGEHVKLRGPKPLRLEVSKER
jgi:pyrimidine operon attenuation protein / uracil phosphoribosyltransferase